MSLTQLLEKILSDIQPLLKDYADGSYWQEEGWSDEHRAMFPEAEVQLESFLRQSLEQAYLQGVKEGYYKCGIDHKIIK